jgi:hypothetical protein
MNDSQFIQLAYSKYIRSDCEISKLEEQVRSLHEYKPALMRMNARHMNCPWYFTERQYADYTTNIWDGLNEYYKAHNNLGRAIEYKMAYEYLMFMIYKYSHPPKDLTTLAIRPYNMIETIERIILDLDGFKCQVLELSNALLNSYQVDDYKWEEVWRKHDFAYPRIYE